MRTQTQAQLAAMVEEYRRTRARMAGLTAEVGALTATARSADGCVSATVGPRGQLCDLSIDAEVARRLDLRTLTARILEAAELAAEQARDAVGRVVTQALPEHLRPVAAADLGDLLPEDIRALLGRRTQERP